MVREGLFEQPVVLFQKFTGGRLLQVFRDSRLVGGEHREAALAHEPARIVGGAAVDVGDRAGPNLPRRHREALHHGYTLPACRIRAEQGDEEIEARSWLHLLSGWNEQRSNPES